MHHPDVVDNWVLAVAAMIFVALAVAVGSCAATTKEECMNRCNTTCSLGER